MYEMQISSPSLMSLAARNSIVTALQSNSYIMFGLQLPGAKLSANTYYFQKSDQIPVIRSASVYEQSRVSFAKCALRESAFNHVCGYYVEEFAALLERLAFAQALHYFLDLRVKIFYQYPHVTFHLFQVSVTNGNQQNRALDQDSLAPLGITCGDHSISLARNRCNGIGP